MPPNVQAYYDAQWWILIHWGIPLCFIALILLGIFKWLMDKYDE